MDLNEIYDLLAENEISPLETVGACEYILRSGKGGATRAQKVLAGFKKSMKLNDEEWIGFVKMVQDPLL